MQSGYTFLAACSVVVPITSVPAYTPRASLARLQHASSG